MARRIPQAGAGKFASLFFGFLALLTFLIRRAYIERALCGWGQEREPPVPMANRRDTVLRLPWRASATLRAGFTLIELLVALAVMSVAVSVFISMYGSSLDLATTAKQRSLALNLAEEQLAAITSHPAHFVWKLPEDGAEQTRFAIELTGEDPKAGNEAGVPGAMPADPAAFRRAGAEHENFRWYAQGSLQPGGAFYEVTVVVKWEEQARPRFLTLTSAVQAASVPQDAGDDS